MILLILLKIGLIVSVSVGIEVVLYERFKLDTIRFIQGVVVILMAFWLGMV